MLKCYFFLKCCRHDFHYNILQPLSVPDSSKTSCLSPSIPIGEAIKSHLQVLASSLTDIPHSQILELINHQLSYFSKPLFPWTFSTATILVYHCPKGLLSLVLLSSSTASFTKPLFQTNWSVYHLYLLYTFAPSTYSSHFLISLANLHDHLSSSLKK